ncbi:nuclear transport factor 2 family protein [Pendulispora albinea]|uniref:Nuclear transport factor 2 family protein n=1 Tax=Pendulispora albinea TaxID=2741071 RepID=A0ABZ2MBW6_9BACT
MTTAKNDTRAAFELPTQAQLESAARWVQGFAERWNPLDPERLRDLMHPDTRNTIPPMTEPADREGVIAHFVRTKERVPDLVLQVERWAATGDTVFVEWCARATVAGRALTWRGIDRVRLRDGRTYEGEAHWDTRRVAELVSEAMAAAASGTSPR